MSYPHSGHVLLVDDDPSFRQLIRPALESLGCTVHEAENGEIAKRMVRESFFDLLIVDGLLPDGDGVLWISWLRKAGQQTPVVFVSSFRRDSSQFTKVTRELQVSLVLRKPILLEAFTTQIAPFLPARTPEDNEPIDGALLLTPAEPTTPPSAPKADEDDFASEFQALIRTYVEGLPAKLRELRAAITQARLDGVDSPIWKEARSLAHRLRGTAGSYGEAELGEKAGVIEDWLTASANGPPPSDIDWAIVEGALDEADQLATLAYRLVLQQSLPPSPIPVLEPEAVPAAAGETLLLVDDDPAQLLFLSELARRYLIPVITARSPAEALAVARHTPPSAALLDVNLGPDELAFRLAFQLRAQAGQSTLPIGFMSADRGQSNRVAAAYAGAAFFLSKPIEPAEFAQAARQLLALRRIAAPHALVADDPQSASRLVSLLKSAGFRVTTCSDSDRLEDLVIELKPDVLLLSTGLPGVSPFDICRAIRMRPEVPELPILFVAPEGRPAPLIAAYRAGGDDLLRQPVVEEELLARVTMLVERQRMRRERVSNDPLTGLRTRTAFIEELSQQLTRAQRDDRSCVLAMIGVDGLSNINDTHGSIAGDRVLAALGQQLRTGLMNDVARGRWSGGEFALAFPAEDVETVSAVLTRLSQEFARTTFEGADHTTFTTTLQWGLAISPINGVTADELSRSAERSLRSVRQSRRGSAA